MVWIWIQGFKVRWASRRLTQGLPSLPNPQPTVTECHAEFIRGWVGWGVGNVSVQKALLFTLATVGKAWELEETLAVLHLNALSRDGQAAVWHGCMKLHSHASSWLFSHQILGLQFCCDWTGAFVVVALNWENYQGPCSMPEHAGICCLLALLQPRAMFMWPSLISCSNHSYLSTIHV